MTHSRYLVKMLDPYLVDRGKGGRKSRMEGGAWGGTKTVVMWERRGKSEDAHLDSFVDGTASTKTQNTEDGAGLRRR